jgi:hypothetical protein
MAFDDKFRLDAIQQQRISDCLNYSGVAINAKF